MKNQIKKLDFSKSTISLDGFFLYIGHRKFSDMDKKIDILLITAISRCEFIDVLIKHTFKIVGMFEERFNFQWLICVDYGKLKGDDRDKIVKMYYDIANTNIDLLGVDSGNGDNLPCYGGDIYNEGLTHLFRKMSDGYNPWCYILDDDNVINPNMFEYIADAEDKGCFDGMWLNYQMDNGKVLNQMIGYDALVMLNGANRHSNLLNPYLNNPDPSSILLKLDVYRKNFPMLGGVDYDFTYIRPIIENLADECRLYCQCNNMVNFWECNIGAYHNGIARKERYEYDSERMDNVDIVVTVTHRGVDDKQTRYVIDPDAVPELMEFIGKNAIIGNV